MNKKGFTLIELLAVIVILAIIALIATPIVLNIIKDSRESAGLRSAEMYLKGVETSVATATINNKKVGDGTYPITPDGDICLVALTDNKCDKDNTLEVEMNGDKPESGSITIANGKVKYISLTYSNGKTIVKNEEGKLVYNQDNKGNSTLVTDYIINLYNDGSEINTVNISGDTTKPTVNLNATQGIMLDNNGEYRYYGKSPNNYVSFNGELWRIINVANVKSSEEDTTGEIRVRIIKSTSIGNHVWDSGASNNWETATLNKMLNGIYYNATAGTCYVNTDMGIEETICDYSDNGTIKGLNSEAKNLIDNAVWYLGGIYDSAGIYASDWYNVERGTVVNGDNPTRTVSPLGIIYPSDYAYAADLSVCTKPATGSYIRINDTYVKDDYGNDTINCTGTDWLFNNDSQWLLSPCSECANVYGVLDSGSFSDYDALYTDDSFLGVRPVAVLKSDVIITGGKGTSGEPYQLSLSE